MRSMPVSHPPNEPADISDLIAKLARARLLVTQLDGDTSRWIQSADARNSDLPFVEEIRRRLREEPLFAERMRQTVKDFSALLARTVGTS